MKQIYGLLGKNIGYSLSPKMHNAAFDHFGMKNCRYELFDIGDVSPDEEKKKLEKFFQELIDGKYSGINVTVPYKVKIREMLEMHSNVKFHEIVKVTGALNTIKFDEGKIFATNTDVDGFWDAVREDVGVSGFPKPNVFVIGAGGAGSAISLYLIYSDFVEKIYIYDVDNEKLARVKARFLMMPSHKKVSDLFATIENKEDIPEKIQDCDLLINATPIGTKENDGLPLPLNILKELKKDAAVYDLIYTRETKLVGYAKEKLGLKASGGLGMLVNQAAAAFRIWTGIHDKEVKNVMRISLPAELKEKYKWNI